MRRGTLDLPEGLTTRPLATADARAVFEVMAAQEQADIGMVEIEEADIVSDWAPAELRRLRLDRRGVRGRPAGRVRRGLGARPGRRRRRPGHRGRGIGTALAGWMQEPPAARGSSVIGMPVPEGSAGDLLLADLGYRVRWTSWVLKLPPGATIVERPLPEGYAVRAAEPDEYPAVHTVVEDAFLEWSVREREPYDDFLAQTKGRPGFEPWQIRVVDRSPTATSSGSPT